MNGAERILRGAGIASSGAACAAEAPVPDSTITPSYRGDVD
jgi:hypothetical protein